MIMILVFLCQYSNRRPPKYDEIMIPIIFNAMNNETLPLASSFLAFIYYDSLNVYLWISDYALDISTTNASMIYGYDGYLQSHC